MLEKKKFKIYVYICVVYRCEKLLVLKIKCVYGVFQVKLQVKTSYMEVLYIKFVKFSEDIHL